MIARLLLTAFGAAAVLTATEAPPDHRLFTGDNVHEIWLTFKQTDWFEHLTKNYEADSDDPEYLEASFQWNEVGFERIGVRFKGNSSYNGADKKKPFRLKLNKYVKGQKIDGVAALNLSNFWNDPSFVREKLYYELANAAGLASPRANFAALYVNGAYWGLYSLVEIVNEDFLDTRFPKNNKGSLYKGDPSGTMEDKGDDESVYASYYEKKTNESDSWSDLLNLISVLNRSTSEEFATKIATVLDVDSLLTSLALDNITANLDNYIGMGHNYYLYFRPSDGKAQFLPWDPSLAFGAFSQGMTVEDLKNLKLEWTASATQSGGTSTAPQMPGGGTPPTGDTPPSGGTAPDGGAAPGGNGKVQASFGGARPLITKLWEVPEFLARYREIVKQLNQQVVRPDAVIARMEALRTMISPWVEKDANKLVTMDQFNKAMTEDQTVQNSFGGGATMPTPPSGTDPSGTPPSGTPPSGANPGGGQQGFAGNGGGMTVPGITAFVKARETSVNSQLESK